MIAPGQELPRVHMMICCPGAMFMCDRWYHLTCIDITEEMAKELSAWICKQCKDSFSLINTLKNDVLQSTDAIQDLKKELYTLKNNVSHLPCQKDMKEQSNGGHLSDPWKSKHNFETTPVPFDIKTPQGQTRSARHTESTPYYLKLWISKLSVISCQL